MNSAVYVMKWMEWGMRKKLGMLAVNMRVLAVNVRQKTLNLKLMTGMERRVRPAKLNKRLMILIRKIIKLI
jgi:hypothetical protein